MSHPITLTLSTRHPNEDDLTDDGRQYAYSWLRNRYTAELSITMPDVTVILRYVDSPESLLLVGDPLTRTMSGSPKPQQARLALYGALMDWHRHVAETNGSLPNGQPMFTEMRNAAP